MHRRRNERRKRRRQEGSTASRHAKRRPEDRLRGGGSQTDERLGLDQCELRLEPRPARRDLRRIGFLVDPLLSSWFPFEVFDDIGHVDARATDASSLQTRVEQVAGGTDERSSLSILLITRLLAEKKNLGVYRTFTEHRLSRALPERTGAAARGGASKRRGRWLSRNERRSGFNPHTG